MSKTGKIAALIAVVAMIAIIGVIIVFMGKGDNKNVSGSGTEYDSKDLNESTDGISIVFKNDSIEASGNGVSVDGTTLKITAPGNYVLSGECENGKVIIEAGKDNDVHLVLNSLNLTSKSSAPIFEKSGSKVVITLTEGSKNILSDKEGYMDNSSEDKDIPNAALCISGDLSINGNGYLEINANAGNAIKSKDDLKIVSGEFKVNSIENAVVGNDSISIKDGKFNIISKGDAFKTHNDTDADKGKIIIEGGTFNIESEEDGLQANTNMIINAGEFTISATKDGIKSDGQLEINDGDIKVTKCDEGLEAQYIVINNGNIDIISSDDGINATDGTSGGMGMHPGEGNADCGITINGGSLSIDASGDGIDSNAMTYVNGGTVIINGPVNNGNGAIDSNNQLLIKGGELLAVGSAGMAEAASLDSTQNTISLTISRQEAEAVIKIVSADGDEIFSYKAKKQFENVCFSSSKLEKDKEYIVYVNDTEQKRIKVTDVVTTDGTVNGMGGMKPGFGTNRPGQRTDDFKKPADGKRPSFNQDDLPEGMPEFNPDDMPKPEGER